MILHCPRTMLHAVPNILLALFLAGCASDPPERFYTLAVGTHEVTPAESATAPTAVPLYVEIIPVSVPSQVSRTQMVVQIGGRVDILEQQRWASPLSDEIRQALSLGITSQLGAIDVYRTPYPEKAAVYRVSTNVQRFESVPGQYALVDAVWSVRQLSSGTVLVCRTMVRESIGAGYEALVTGHRKAVAKIATEVASTIRRMANGTSAGCLVA